MDRPDCSKLPRWAQKYIENIERERFVAVRALREYTNNQTESKFFIDEYECTGDDGTSGPSSYRRYIQTYKISVAHNGVRLDVMIRDDHIDLQWGDDKRNSGQVAFIPRSYQAADLYSKEFMR